MTPTLNESYAACARVARREAKNFYPSFLLLPADRRRSMCALYAFLRHSDDLADEPGEPAEQRFALNAWRQSLKTALTGIPSETAFASWPGWPALAETVRRHAVPHRYLFDVLDGVAMDLAPVPFASEADLFAYCDRVASAVGLCCLHIWGFRSQQGRAEALAAATGRALQLTNIIRDVREDARNGRVYLPLDDLDRFGVDPSDLRADAVTGPLRRLLAFESRRAYDLYEEARDLVPLVEPVGRPVLLALAGVYRRLLDEIVRRDYDVFSTRVTVPAWRKAVTLAYSFAARLGPPPPAEVGDDPAEPPRSRP